MASYTKTKFGAIAVGHHGSGDGNETNFMTVDTSGTAVFAGPIQVSGRVSAAGSLYVDGSVASSGPIKSGGAGSLGTSVLMQRVTIAAANTAGAPVQLNLPSGSNLIQMYVDVEEPYTTGAGATAAEVNVSAVNGVTLARIAVSASTRHYHAGLGGGSQAAGGTAWRNVTTTLEAHVSIQGSATAMSAGQAMLTVLYVNV